VANLERALGDITTAEFLELLALDRIAAALHAISMRLGRVEATIAQERKIMSEVDDRLAQLTNEVGDAAATITNTAADVNRALADLRDALSGVLSADQVAKFDALDQSVAGLKDAAAGIKAAVENVDPGTEPTPPTV
jgi:uncharacterized protein YukE